MIFLKQHPESFAIACLLFSFLACGSSGRVQQSPASSPVTQIASRNLNGDDHNRLGVRPDFSNFVYSLEDGRKIKLKDGRSVRQPKKNGLTNEVETYLQSVVYEDVTNDGIEDAIVVIGIVTGGSATPHHIFLYGLNSGPPKLLWTFVSGDRADGGLRKVYSADGALIVELYGRDRVIGGNLYKGDEGTCCPKWFTRTRYIWMNKNFAELGAPELHPNPDTTATVLMREFSN